jgi:hypothetical protein
MAYNSKNDKVIKELKPIPAVADTEFRFKIMQYGKGEKKLQITKTFWHEESKEFREMGKLGRLTVEQIAAFKERFEEAEKLLENEKEE